MKKTIFKTGFTLTEILVVVLIMGILASLALPMMLKTVEKAKTAEVVANLNLIRAAEKSYFLENSSYTDDIDALSIESPNAEASRYFDYSIVGIVIPKNGIRRPRRANEIMVMVDFIVTATRREPAPDPYSTYFYQISKDGVIYSNGPFFPNLPPRRG